MMYDGDEYTNDEMMWVKAGEPGEKPTILRQVRSESLSSGSRDNSGSSCNHRNVLTVDTTISSDSIHKIGRLGTMSSNDSRVIVLNVCDNYPSTLDKEKIKRWRNLHSPTRVKKTDNRLNTKNDNFARIGKSRSQPIEVLTKCSPNLRIKRSSSVEAPNKDLLLPVKTIKSRDEGYTSLSEDYKESSESLRSKTLPSSWRPITKTQRDQNQFASFAKRMTSEQEEVSSVELNTCKCKQNKEKRKKDRYHLENAIEMCTCFVCVRSVFYHTQAEEDSVPDHPCQCSSVGSGCCGRWCLIGLMVCFLPLLIFYPPLKLCLCIHDARMKRKRSSRQKRMSKKRLLP